ncbi:MAG: complex I subunit 5 family protein [Gemmatimonadota bacterium]
MNTLLLLTAIILPAVVAPLVFGASRPALAVRALAPWAASPALLLALSPLGFPSIELPWVVAGVHFELDLIGRVFLIVTAALWTAAGVYASGYMDREGWRRFLFFFLLTMAGNLGLPIAGDAVSFYFFFALMTFAGYGLIVHAGDQAARRAGRVYLVLAVIGEAFLLAGLVLAVDATGSILVGAIPAGVARSPDVGAITACLMVGFAIKAGAVPLHVWLPLAHPVAPTPASAVLSGSMIKGGLLGWLRFFPLGEATLPEWGVFVVAMGIVAAFFGVVVGLVQTDAKTVLAYSSISQMGLINIGVGIALTAPDSVVPAIGAIMLYATHHGLAKGALFLGVGVAEARTRGPTSRRLILFGLGLPALAIAGAPLTSGAIAKQELKQLTPLLPDPWPHLLDWLLPLSAIATTLLMVRFLVLTQRRLTTDAGHRLVPLVWIPWAALVTAVAVLFWILPYRMPVLTSGTPHLPGPDALAAEVLPILAGVAAFVAVVRLRRRWAPAWIAPHIVPGDILAPVERALARLPRPDLVVERLASGGITGGMSGQIARRWYRIYSESARYDPLIRLELRLTRWAAGIGLLLLVTASLLFLLAWGS